MRNDIIDLYNKEEGKIGHVVGHGPSLNQYMESLSRINREKEVILSLNDCDIIFKDSNIYPDYWLTTNPECTVPKYYERINSYQDVTFLFCDCMDLTNYEEIDRLLTVKYYGFDACHFNSQPNIHWLNGQRRGCNRGWIDCCSRLIPGRLTIQEHLQKLSGYEYHYSYGDTTILPVIALSIILGCKKIYLYGVDLDYRLGYANSTNHTLRPYIQSDNHEFENARKRILSDLYIINESAKILNSEIYYLGFNEEIKQLFMGKVPETVYKSDCKNFI